MKTRGRALRATGSGGMVCAGRWWRVQAPSRCDLHRPVQPARRVVSPGQQPPIWFRNIGNWSPACPLDGEGWETARSSENDWVIIALAGACRLHDVVFDTSHFLGNAPGEVQMVGRPAPAHLCETLPGAGLDETLPGAGLDRALAADALSGPDATRRMVIGAAGGIHASVRPSFLIPGGRDCSMPRDQAVAIAVDLDRLPVAVDCLLEDWHRYPVVDRLGLGEARWSWSSACRNW